MNPNDPFDDEEPICLTSKLIILAIVVTAAAAIYFINKALHLH